MTRLFTAVPVAFAAVLILSPASFAVAQIPADPIELPLARAVLMSSGVGYFEHSGSVDGGGLIRLNFKAEQINDVLKSMVLMDEGGGTLSTVTYPSNDPIARSLKSFGVDISGNPSLPELLQQLRGAEVTVMAPDKVTGSILNIESRQEVIGDPPTSVTRYTLNLVSTSGGGGIRAIPMQTVSSIELADPKLRDELNKALALLVASRDTDRRPVDIRFEGQGNRRVRIGYLVETPVWKTSYRLDLTGLEAESKAGGGPLLQGWAIVENTSDNDWKNVTLSLVSGRPISFVMDMYTPFYLPRPVVVPERFASLMPRVYDEGLVADKEVARLGVEVMEAGDGVAGRRQMRAKAAPAPSRAQAPGAGGGRGGGGGGPQDPAGFMDGQDQAFALGQGVESLSQAASLGELFSFTIDQPVDLARRRSAMLPIVNEPVKAEKVSIYNQQVLAKHPLNGVYLTNSTQLKLPDGPVTVFDGGSYAGDAQVDHMAPGDKRLLSYAVDLSVTVDPSQNSTDRLVSGKIVKGVLELTRLNLFEQTYVIKNKADAKRTMIVEHPFVNGRELLEPKQAEEKTPAMYRFRVPIAADTTGKFLVKEQQTVDQRIAILDQSPDSLLWYAQQGVMPDAVKQALQKAAALKRELATLETQLNTLQTQQSQIKQGQDRLRQNLASVGQDSQLGKRYLAKLNAEEDEIESLEKQIVETRGKVEAKRSELATYLANLNLS